MSANARSRNGYTVIELLMTVAIVALLVATAGGWFVKLLKIQEKEREEAYVREKLVDICGSYADMVSIGSFICENPEGTGNSTAVKYRTETGGVSFETGLVTRVAYVTTSFTNNLSLAHRTMNLGIYSTGPEEGARFVPLMDDMVHEKMSRNVEGDALLVPQLADLVSCTITPLWTGETDAYATNAALGYLQVTARYVVEDENGRPATKTATAGRVVRLWNHQ